jgi:hypothetical protein
MPPANGKKRHHLRTRVAFNKPTLPFFESRSLGYNFPAKTSILAKPSPRLLQTALRTACGPKAPSPRTAPSYLPEGGFVAPSGEGKGDELSAEERVDIRPSTESATFHELCGDQNSGSGLTRLQSWVLGSERRGYFAQDLRSSRTDLIR